MAKAFDLEAIRRDAGKADAGVSGWLIKAPWAHQLWHSYILFLLHLRPLEGFPWPKIYVKGATHEIVLFATDPEAKIQLDKPASAYLLHPPNFAAQFISDGDETAALKIQEVVVKIVEGRLSPDTDHTQSWIAIFNAGMIKGNPDTAGETRIIYRTLNETTEVVHDPKPPGALPDLNPPWES